ncbi:MAG: acyl-CoA carboxylase subunit beta [Deltaproteobacteria bacterium]|nr:acyl-CoA carboxylase subunit beta [Deltaproteobacteria bacterium]
MLSKIRQIEDLREIIRQGGGPDAVAAQRRKGKLTARERLAALFDPHDFTELDVFARHLGRDYGLDRIDRIPADGVIIGHGRVGGRPVAAFSQDFTVLAGTCGEMHGRKIARIVELAATMGCPLVGLMDSGGGRVSEELGALSQYGRIFHQQVQASGVVPQLALILGPVAGGQAYSPALMDVIFMVEGTATMFLAGPPLVEAVVHEHITEEELGGARLHARESGTSDLTCRDDLHAIGEARRLLSFLPSSNREGGPPEVETGDDPGRLLEELPGLLPVDPEATYDMHRVLELLLDRGELFELKPEYAENLITGLGRIGGRSVGIVASNPGHRAGCIDTRAAVKAARFVRFCDQFGIPLLTLQDVPGFLVGSRSEREGIVRHGAKMLYAYAEATVPKVTVVLRKAYAGGYLALCPKELGADFVFGLPTAEIGLMGPQGAVSVLFRKELARAAAAGEDVAALRDTLGREFRDRYLDPLYPAGLQVVDDIIDPRELRRVVHRALELCRGKRHEPPRRKHGNLPL